MLNNKLELPCGVVLPNRLAKSAMSENMAVNHHSKDAFFNAYSTWAKGGTGLIISGNVMIDSRHLGEPNNVVIEKGLDNHRDLKNWAKANIGTGNHIWLQLNHPGKQSPNYLTKVPVAPSAIPLAGALEKMFNSPVELTAEQIADIVERFAYAAKVAKDCGFGGVQIHGAHGYLVSQFLSSKHNQRSDKYGGSIANRTNFIKEIYHAMRAQVGDKYPIGIKMNSADFSKGGFTREEAIYVAKVLSEIGMDLIEISGGSYEKPVMTGTPIKDSTKKREAYFLEYAKGIKDVISCPLMVTGGFRTGAFMNEALQNNELDIVGLARPLAINPDLSNQLLSGQNAVSQVRPLSSGLKAIDSIVPLEIVWYTYQIQRMGKNKTPDPKASVYSAILMTVYNTGLQMFKKMRA
jgi:2,4-dienoyl-CoA reductase-like NADH-dependent reductase (Old Yellow Enzyme family)